MAFPPEYRHTYRQTDTDSYVCSRFLCSGKESERGKTRRRRKSRRKSRK